jgi:drug/metabolite transporter (DMT)-like permease
MSRLLSRTHVLTIVVILSNVLGNLALSMGMKAQTAAPQGSAFQLGRVFLSPLVLLGIALLVFWMLSRMTLMSWADLSYIVPVTAIGYVLTALSGKYLLGENISGTRWLGTLLIVAGTIIVSLTAPKTRTDP